LAISFEPGTAVEFTCYWNGEPETIRGITVEDSANNQFRIAVDIEPGQRLKSRRVIRNRSALRARTVALFGHAGGAPFDSGPGSSIPPDKRPARHHKPMTTCDLAQKMLVIKK
jgi:hypothetical protein